ncbi:uncharacterized protein LOC144224471 [Crocuta crocuta]
MSRCTSATGPQPPGSYNGGRRATTLKSSLQEPAQRSSLCAQPPPGPVGARGPGVQCGLDLRLEESPAVPVNRAAGGDKPIYYQEHVYHSILKKKDSFSGEPAADFIRKAGGLPDRVKKLQVFPCGRLDLLPPQPTLTSLPLRSEATLNSGFKSNSCPGSGSQQIEEEQGLGQQTVLPTRQTDSNSRSAACWLHLGKFTCRGRSMGHRSVGIRPRSSKEKPLQEKLDMA